MTIPHISPVKDESLAAQLDRAINNKTKPLGSLGALEPLAHKVGMIGSVSIPLADMPGALREFISGQPASLPGHLLGLRLERAATAFVTGASLSLAGVMMQALLRNPLADP